LGANGAAIVKTGTLYRVDTAERARNVFNGIQVGNNGAGSGIGAGLRVVSLRFVSATVMQRILEPMVGTSMIVCLFDRIRTYNPFRRSTALASTAPTGSSHLPTFLYGF